MIWQDFVMGVGAWMFFIALLPAIKSNDKSPTSTSLLTAGVLSVYVVCMATLGLMLSAVSTAITAACWWILFVQKLKKKGN